jgi:hypothetical protein
MRLFIPNDTYNHPELAGRESRVEPTAELWTFGVVAAETLDRLRYGLVGLSVALPGTTAPAIDFQVAITDSPAQDLADGSGDLGRYLADHRLDSGPAVARMANLMAGT